MSEITIEILRSVTQQISASLTSTQAPVRKQLSSSTLSLIGRGNSPETEREKNKLIGALAFLDPDSERGSGSFYDGLNNPERKIWLAVIWSVASLKWLSGKEIAREWSQKSSRYTVEGFEAAWRDYNSALPNSIGIGSLYKRAKELGWHYSPELLNNHPQQSTLPSNEVKFKLLSVGDVERMAPSKWIVKGVIPETGLASIYGPSGSGKTFLALDLIAAIASKEEWFGFKVTNVPVVYLGLEGKAGIARRIQAWIKKHGKLGDNFKLVLDNFNLMERSDVEVLADLLIGSKLVKGLVVIDTLNQATPSADENSSKDMGLIISHLKLLQELTSSLVLIIHHTGKNTSAGLRGHSSLKAALDINIEVLGGSNRSWMVEKNKEGADGHSFPFKLTQITLGQDDDGDLITSCVVERDSSVLLQLREPSGKNQKAVLKLIKNALFASVDLNRCEAGAEKKCIRVEEAILIAAGALATVVKNKRANLARSVIASLVENGFFCSGIEAEEGWIWLR